MKSRHRISSISKNHWMVLCCGFRDDVFLRVMGYMAYEFIRGMEQAEVSTFIEYNWANEVIYSTQKEISFTVKDPHDVSIVLPNRLGTRNEDTLRQDHRASSICKEVFISLYYSLAKAVARPRGNALAVHIQKTGNKWRIKR